MWFIIEHRKMGMYTYYNIECQLPNPESVEILNHFKKNDDWPEPPPNWVLTWREFLKKTGNYHTYKATTEYPEVSFYHYAGLECGMSGHWNSQFRIENDVLSISGSLKNYRFELEYFVQQVLIFGLGGTILTCEITNDRALSMDYSLHGPVINYSDNDLRNRNVCF